ncbi:MAG: hypothetical protein ACRCVX_12390 [Shewanella sp.]
MNETPLDRAAIALRNEIAGYEKDGEWILEEGFRDMDHFRNVARAVLMAIREPSSEMIEDAYNSYAANNGSLRDVFMDMIDVVLE